MKYVLILIVVLFIGSAVWYLGVKNGDRPLPPGLEGNSINNIKETTTMKLTSNAFENNGLIPKKYTCDGQNINPPLIISSVPEKARSLVLIMEDVDVPKNIRPDGIWIHWVIFNMSTSTKNIGEESEVEGTYGAGTSKTTKYVGPCPPGGEHRYYFNLYALDAKLDLPTGATKDEVLSQAEGHILEKTELLGRFGR